MKKTILLSIVFIALFSCHNIVKNPATEPNSMDNDSVIARVMTGSLLGEYCYGYINKKDSVFLMANISDSSVGGTLQYSLNEKDRNKGTIIGKMMGDTLLADYTFMSEGMQSVRQVAFVLDDSTAKEGHGEMMQNGDKMVFVNPAKITFDTTMILSKKECMDKK